MVWLMFAHFFMARIALDLYHYRSFSLLSTENNKTKALSHFDNKLKESQLYQIRHWRRATETIDFVR